MQNDSDTLQEGRLSIGKAAKYLGVSIDTLRRWEKNGRITALRSPGGHRYFEGSQLDNLFGKKYTRDQASGRISKTYVTTTGTPPSQDTAISALGQKTPAPSVAATKPQPAVEPKMEPEQDTVPVKPIQSKEAAELTHEQKKRLEDIVLGEGKRKKPTLLLKLAVVGLIVFTIIDLILAYIFFSSSGMLSPIP